MVTDVWICVLASLARIVSGPLAGLYIMSHNLVSCVPVFVDRDGNSLSFCH